MIIKKPTREFEFERAKLSALDFCSYCRMFIEEITYLSNNNIEEFKKTKINIDAYKSKAFNLILNFCKIVDCNANTNFDTKVYNIYDLVADTKNKLLDMDQMQIIEKFDEYRIITNELFLLEEALVPTINKMWTNVLSSSTNTKKYSIFAKTLYNWRTAQRYTKETVDYMNNRLGLSVSYINNTKSRFFFDSVNVDTHIGVIYKSKSIISASHCDANTYEKINGVCPIDTFFMGSNVWRVFNEKGHEIFSKSLKISSPDFVLYGNSDFLAHNEVVLDRRHAKPVAVFYVAKYNGISYDNRINIKSYKKARQMAKKFHLPLIALESKDETLDLDYMFDDSEENLF